MDSHEKKLVGVKEIARRANVSIATVDRVLHKRSGVSLQTKEKIEAIIAELDYQPNILARRLASKKVVRLAVLIPSVSEETAFWQYPLDGILRAEDEIRRYGITIDKFFFDQNEKATFVKKSRHVIDGQYDGLLIAPIFIDESIAFVNKCKKTKIPYVFINSDIPGHDSLCYIGPNLFHSGYMCAHLFKYLVSDRKKILLVNISTEMNAHHHLLRKEEGFRAYMIDHHIDYEILKLDIRQTDYTSVKLNLDRFFAQEKDVNAIFVTNSRVSSVARYLQQQKMEKIKLIGFDFLPGNIEFLKEDIIDFLICQKPREQGYRGIMALYNMLVNDVQMEKINFMPIDIVTRENYMFYEN